MDEEKLLKKKKNNINIYKYYRVFSWDILFYYAIIYLFLITQKSLTPAEILQFDAFYMLFKCLVQIPCTLLIQKIGKRNSLVIANLIGIIHVLLIIFAANYTVLIISQLLCAITFIVRGTCESDMLYDSLEHNEERGHKFAKIDGKAYARFYFVDAIAAVASGFLYVVNPFIPLILCTITFIITFVLSLRFEEIHTEKKKMHIKEEMKILRGGMRNILHSKRLMCLVMFNALVVGLFKIVQNIRNVALLDVGLPEQYFGVVFAILSIATGLFARLQGRIHKRHGNRTLAYISIPTAVSCFFMGLILLIKMPQLASIILIVLLLIRVSSNKGPYFILIKRYLNNFTNSEKRIRIATINNIFENAIAAILIFGASFILEHTAVSYATLLIGGIFVIVITLLLDYMKTRVGLKPEEYSDREILKND